MKLLTQKLIYTENNHYHTTNHNEAARNSMVQIVSIGNNIEMLDHSLLEHGTIAPTGNSFQLSSLHSLYYERRVMPNAVLFDNLF